MGLERGEVGHVAGASVQPEQSGPRSFGIERAGQAEPGDLGQVLVEPHRRTQNVGVFGYGYTFDDSSSVTLPQAGSSVDGLVKPVNYDPQDDAMPAPAPGLRRTALLSAQLAHAKSNAPAYARLLAEVDTTAVTTRAALASLPVVRKSELLELQKASRPFGGFAASGWGAHPRRARLVFASPGPLYEPEGFLWPSVRASQSERSVRAIRASSAWSAAAV